MQRKYLPAPTRSPSNEDHGNQKSLRGAAFKRVGKQVAVACGVFALVLTVIQIREGSKVPHKNAASIEVTIRSLPTSDTSQLGRKVSLGRVAGVVDERLVQAAANEHKPGVQLLQPQQPLVEASGGVKETGPHPTQNSLGDLRQAAREQAAINSGAAGVGVSAAQAELVVVARPPPPPPDQYEAAIAQAAREKDFQRVKALKEARERAGQTWGALGARMLDRASRLAHGAGVEGRKQLELDGAGGGGGLSKLRKPAADLATLSRLQALPGTVAVSNTASLEGLKVLREAAAVAALTHVQVTPDGALGAGAALHLDGTADGAKLSNLPAGIKLPTTLVAELQHMPELAKPLAIADSDVAVAATTTTESPLGVLRDNLQVDGPFADESARRQSQVKKAMAHSWAGYVKYAWGYDELRPMSKDGENSFCGLGATLVDSLDTLWLMDMKQEFHRAVDWVRDVFTTEKECAVSVFETFIRIVGGMLSAYELSGDQILLTRAEELTQVLLTSFNTPMGFPQATVSLKYRVAGSPSWIGYGSAILSELGTVQMELIKLSQLTGNATYGEAGEKIIRNIHEKHPNEGLLPMYLSSSDASGSGKLTMGAMADSYYEYLLKVWILKGRTQDAEMYRSMWETAMDDMREKLTRTSPTSNFTYVGETGFGLDQVIPKMEHLTCFIAGNLALGVEAGAVKGAKAAEYLELAKNLTYTCYQMYKRMPTGLSPEYVDFPEGSTDLSAGYNPYNILRPEVVESIFMLWRITKDPEYLEWGWQIFEAFEKYCKVPTGGYSGPSDVTKLPPNNSSKMESFWLGETLKYLYLLFSPTGLLPLDQWVFNTEAHPLKVSMGLQPLSRSGIPAIMN